MSAAEPGIFGAERVARLLLSAGSGEGPSAVVLATWPAGGREALLSAAGDLDGTVTLPGPDEGSLVERLAARLEAAGESASSLVVVPDETVLPDDLESAVEACPEAIGPLVLATLGRPSLGALAVRVVPGDALRLDRDEMASYLAATDRPRRRLDSRLDALARLTDGWVGPFLRLVDEEDPESAACDEAFRTWFDQRVLAPLGTDARAVLVEIASAAGDAEAEAIDPELWRRRFLEAPARLAAFEALRHRWGLLPPGPSGLRPPSLLLRILGRDLTRAKRRETARALAVAAADSDRPDDAIHWLERAGDEARARRWRRLSVEAPGVAIGSTAGSAAGAFALRLLGPPEIVRVGADGRGEALEWRLRRALLLVAFLALAPERRATRDELVTALFADASPGAVERNFHPTVSDARRTLADGAPTGGPAILHRAGVYLLDPAVRWGVDRDRFVAAAERAEALRTGADGTAAGAETIDALRHAWSLYRGPLLQGFDASWIADERDRLHRHYLGVLRRTGELAARADRPVLALDAWRALLVHEPFEETAHLAAMELYGRQGRRDLVRRQFVRLQELLKELRVEPATETVARYHDLMH